MRNKDINIGAVIVTYNRLEKLKLALQSFSIQSTLPSYIIVVDNASSDGTLEFLEMWKNKNEGFEKNVLSLNKNIGGSGGFFEGIKEALQKEADWIWISDDDAYPEKNCIENAVNCISQLDDPNKYSAVCGTVLYDGKICYKHRRRTFHKFFNYYSIPVEENEYQNNFFCNTFSFVGAILNRSKINLVGLPQKDYFIWNDDTEYSLRMSKVGKIKCFPSIKVFHDEGIESVTLSWKTYYGFRNRLNMIDIHFPKYVFFYQWIKVCLIALRQLFTNKEEGILYFTAAMDAIKKRFGIHPIYKPGWKINNSKDL